MSKRSYLILIRLFSACLLILLYHLNKYDNEALVKLNTLLFVLALTDFGYQQTCLMRWIKIKWMMLDVSLFILLIGFAYIFSEQNTSLIRLIFIGYLINSLNGLFNALGKMYLMLSIAVVRFFILYSFFLYEGLALVSTLTLYVFALLFYYKNSSFHQVAFIDYVKKRWEFGVIAICAVLTEQLIRLDANISYEESLLILCVGYIIGLSSIVQQSITQLHFSGGMVNYFGFEVQKFLVVFFALLPPMFFLYWFLKIDNGELLVLCVCVLASNLLLRYSITIDNLSNKSLMIYAKISAACLVFVVVMSSFNITLLHIQGLTALLLMVLLVFKSRIEKV